MEKIPVNNSPNERPKAEMSPEAEVWARIESIDPEAVATMFAELLDKENIQRARQSELNRHTSDIRTAATTQDIEKTEVSIVEQQQKEADILGRFREGTGTFAELDMKITIDKARGKDTTELEQQRAKLVAEMTPLDGELKKVVKKQDWLHGTNAMLQRLAEKQVAYVEQEEPKWKVTEEYRAAMGELALLLERIEKLPRTIAEPVAPPSLALENSTDSLPLSIDGQIEEERQILSYSVYTHTQEVQDDAGNESIDIEVEPKVLSYQELSAMIPSKTIGIPRQRRKIKELIQEDANV